jgi:hypothetical protein
MENSQRKARISSLGRGFFIGAFILVYGFFTHYPQASYTWMFLVGAALQLAIIFLRKFLPPDQWAQAQDIFEMIADGITVLSFALGILGTIANIPAAL